jgi:hypothetical protein
MSATLLRKISPAAIFAQGLPRLDQPGSPKEFQLYNLYGMANGTKQGHTDKGDWLAFRGQFEAMTEGGELYNSGQCFVPQPFEDMLYSQLQESQSKDEKASVQFALRVYLVAPKPGKPSATGYEYRCEPLIEAAPSSPMLMLRETVLQKSKLLAPPQKETIGAGDVGKMPATVTGKK